jgi:hypothetical protein
MNDVLARMGILGELLTFLWSRKLYWLVPMVVVLIVFALLIVLGNTPGVAPFIYTLF